MVYFPDPDLICIPPHPSNLIPITHSSMTIHATLNYCRIGSTNIRETFYFSIKVPKIRHQQTPVLLQCKNWAIWSNHDMQPSPPFQVHFNMHRFSVWSALPENCTLQPNSFPSPYFPSHQISDIFQSFYIRTLSRGSNSNTFFFLLHLVQLLFGLRFSRLLFNFLVAIQLIFDFWRLRILFQVACTPATWIFQHPSSSKVRISYYIKLSIYIIVDTYILWAN